MFSEKGQYNWNHFLSKQPLIGKSKDGFKYRNLALGIIFMSVEKNHETNKLFPIIDYITALEDLAEAAKNANLAKVGKLLDEAVLLAVLEIENMAPDKSPVKIVSYSGICEYDNVVLLRCP